MFWGFDEKTENIDYWLGNEKNKIRNQERIESYFVLMTQFYISGLILINEKFKILRL